MRPVNALLPVVSLALLLSACGSVLPQKSSGQAQPVPSDIPVVSNFKAQPQYRLQAAKHWQAIAQDTAKNLANGLFKSHRCRAGTGVGINPCRPVYVAEPEKVTEFSRAFTNALITALVQQGVNVSEAPEAALVLHLDVQPLAFSANRPLYQHTGAAQEVSPGIWGLNDVTPRTASRPQENKNAESWFRTQFSSSGSTPRTEIVVTLSIMDGIRYAARSTNVYYVMESDAALYSQEICSTVRACPEKQETRSQVPVRKTTLTLIGEPDSTPPAPVSPKTTTRKTP